MKKTGAERTASFLFATRSTSIDRWVTRRATHQKPEQTVEYSHRSESAICPNDYKESQIHRARGKNAVDPAREIITGVNTPALIQVRADLALVSGRPLVATLASRKLHFWSRLRRTWNQYAALTAGSEHTTVIVRGRMQEGCRRK